MDQDPRFINISLKFIRITMEKKVFGIIMTILGLTGFLMAAYNFVSGSTEPNHSVLSFTIYSVLGLLFFFAGIGLIRSEGDLTKRN
jgi:hypothetical protein